MISKANTLHCGRIDYTAAAGSRPSAQEITTRIAVVGWLVSGAPGEVVIPKADVAQTVRESGGLTRHNDGL